MATPYVNWTENAVFFHQIVNHVVIDDDSRVADPTSMTESDGEKPHHIKAGIEPCNRDCTLWK